MQLGLQAAPSQVIVALWEARLLLARSLVQRAGEAVKEGDSSAQTHKIKHLQIEAGLVAAAP